jgi:hypothetical protein
MRQYYCDVAHDTDTGEAETHQCEGGEHQVREVFPYPLNDE